MTKSEKLQIQRIMKSLDCDEETAKDVFECDKRIDKGEKLFELTADQKKAEKAARNFGNCNIYTKPQKKEKQADPEKGKLIGDLLDGIPYAEDVKIINAEREFTFTYKGRKFKIVLSCPRT